MKYSTHVVILTVLWFVVGCSSGTRFDTVSVRGPDGFRVAATNSLGLLKEKSPNSYAVITNNVAVIRAGGHRAMFASAWRPRLELPVSASEDSVTRRAGVIAHYAYHSHLFHQSLREQPNICLPPDAWVFGNAEKKCVEFQLTVLRNVGAPSSELAHAEAEEHTKQNTQVKR